MSSLVADAVKSTISSFQQPSYYNDPIAQADSSNWAPEPYQPPAPQSFLGGVADWVGNAVQTVAQPYAQPSYEQPSAFQPVAPYDYGSVVQQDQSNWGFDPTWNARPATAANVELYETPTPGFDWGNVLGAQVRAAEMPQIVQQDESNWDLSQYISPYDAMIQQQDQTNWGTYNIPDSAEFQQGMESPEQLNIQTWNQAYDPQSNHLVDAVRAFYGPQMDLATGAFNALGNAPEAFFDSARAIGQDPTAPFSALRDYNAAVEERGREYLNEANPSFFDQVTGGGVGRLNIATGRDANNLPGFVPQVLDATLSPASMLTAGGGGAVGQGLRSFLPGNVGRAAANLVEPVVGGGFASRLAGEAAINAGATGGAELANAYLPENMPFRNAAVTAASFLGGGAAVGAGTAAGLKTYQPTAEMVFGTGRVGKPRTVIPDSTSRAAAESVIMEISPDGSRAVLRGRSGLTADGSGVKTFIKNADGTWSPEDYPASRFATLDEARVAMSGRDVEMAPTPQPLANERLWFHSTNDNTFGNLDPDKAVGQAVGNTQGPGSYMAADPAVSAGKYGNRTFVTEFDGTVLDLTRATTADDALFDGGVTWREYAQGVADRLNAAGVTVRGEAQLAELEAALKQAEVEYGRNSVEARRILDKLSRPDSWEYGPARPVTADDLLRKLRPDMEVPFQDADMKTAGNGYALRDTIAGNAAELIRALPAPFKKETADLLAGRFREVKQGWREATMALINDEFANKGVDGLFHHSPRADKDVLIVLNGAAARTLGETRNAADIVSSGKSWPEIVGETRKAKQQGVRLQKIDRPGWEVWAVKRADDGLKIAEIRKEGDEYVLRLLEGEKNGLEVGFATLQGAQRGAASHYGAPVSRYPFPEVRSYGRAKTPKGLETDLQPSAGATDDYGAGVPFFRGTTDPAQKLTEAMNAFTPGEAPSTGLLRQYDGAVKVAGLEMVEDWENGVKVLQKLGLARRSAGQVTVRRTPDMEALFKALHGEGPVPAHLQSVYDDIKRLVDLEAKATEEFDPNFIMREDYFYRGWRAPKETNAGAGGVGAKPGYAKPRTEATFSELLASGWEPVSWNPYDMLALRRMAGVQFREQKAMVQRMIDLGVATKVDGPVPDGYRIPRIGPAFEGKPFAYTDTAKPADAAARLADEGGAARLGFTDRYAVPDGVANTLEELFGRRAADWKAGPVNVSEVWRKSTGGLKRLKLIGSLFQQVDFTTRQGFATFGGVIDDLLHGKPLSAVKKTVMVPADIGKLAWANTRAGRRADLRRQILSDKPIIADRPGLTLKAIAEQGWSTQDITILNRNNVREMTENALKEPPEGWKGGMTLPLRKAQQIDRAMQNGLFDGVYPQAQITALKNFVVPRLVRQHPDWSDARIAASAATEINKMFSTLGAWQTVFKSAPPGFKDFLRGVLFSTNETESLLRQAFSTVSGPNKQMWITYYAGGAVFLGLVANALHYAATGEPLPLDRYQPLEKDENSPLGYRYNSQFLAPEMPGIKGRGGFPVDLDLMGQMDTIFRMLDPKAFFDARFSVPLRAGLNQYTGQDFFGRKLDTPQERLGQLASDLGMPIGAGQALGAAGLGIEGEQRLGTNAQLLQAGGLNLRGRSNADLRDAAAKEKYGEKATWDSLEPYQRNDLMKANPALKEELDTRRDDAIRNDQEWAIDAEQSVQIREDRLADEAEAVRLYAENGDAKAFRDMVSDIQSEAAARSKQARIAAGWDPREPANANERALADYYDAFDVARLPGGGVDFDVLDRELARRGRRWTPEQEAYIERNTGLAEHVPGVQKLYDDRALIRDSGYWELRETAWGALTSEFEIPGYTPGMSYDEYRQAKVAELARYGITGLDAEETAASMDPVLAAFNDFYTYRYLYPWVQENTQAAQMLWEWDYWNPPAEIEQILAQRGVR